MILSILALLASGICFPNKTDVTDDLKPGVNF